MTKISGLTPKTTPTVIPYQKNYKHCDELIRGYGGRKAQYEKVKLLYKESSAEYRISPTEENEYEMLNYRDAMLYHEKAMQALKNKIIKMCMPIIEKKASKISQKFGLSVKDYAQELCLELLENLDSFVNQEAPTRLLIKFLYKLIYKKPNENSFSSMADMYYDDLPDEKKENIENMFFTNEKVEQQLDYEVTMKRIKNLTVSQKTETERYINVLTTREFDVFSRILYGYSIDETGEEFGLRNKTVEYLYKRAIKILGSNRYKPLFSGLTDETKYIPTISADKPAKKEYIGSYYGENRNTQDTEKYSLVDENGEKFSSWGHLDSMIRRCYIDYYYCFDDDHNYFFRDFGRILYDKEAQDKLLDYMEKHPGYKIKLKMDRRIPKGFIPQAEQISMDIFGKNVFEFSK